MSNFIPIRDALNKNIDSMIKQYKKLYVVHIDKDEFWNLYLDSFPKGTNEIFKERREYDCNYCKSFIRHMGNVVAITEDNQLKSIWDFAIDDNRFTPVFKALTQYIYKHNIQNIFISNDKTLGIKQNRQIITPHNITTWNHFYYELPKEFINNSYDTIETIKGNKHASYTVFKGSLQQITIDAIEIILELINSNTLYKGIEWKHQLETLLDYKQKYDILKNDIERDNFIWKASIELNESISRIKNHSIGNLLLDISEGMDLNEAVKRYEKIVAPTSYKRPKAIYTQKMIDDARKKINELGFSDALQRRFANQSDLTINNILYANRTQIGGIKDELDVFESLSSNVAVKAKQFDKVEEVTIEKFINDILPTTRNIEIYLENRLSNNLMSIITAKNKDSKSMFKWNNSFSWTYNNNLTDSLLKEQVKQAGGKVDGVLRFSIRWNDTSGEHDKNDLDAHCITPTHHIYFSQMNDKITQGKLDVDNTYPKVNIPAVENITWPNKDKMVDGTYIFSVHGFANRGGTNGFNCEIEFDGNCYQYDYPYNVKEKETVQIAVVTLKNKEFTIQHNIEPLNIMSKDIWNCKTNTFIPVQMLLHSPNYWDEQTIGNKHYFFILKDCINPDRPSGFFNEYLHQDLNPHRKVFEAISNTMRVEHIDNQLSGIGFSSTQRNDLVICVEGKTKRMLKIKF